MKTAIPRIGVIVSLAVAFLGAAIPRVHATDGTWNLNANGGWDTAGNWSSSVIADGTDATATFGSVITAARTLNLNTSRTIGNIVFDCPTNYTITNLTKTLTLATSSGTPVINLVQGVNQTLNLSIGGTQGFTKNGAAGSNLMLGGTNTVTGTITVNAGTLRANNTNAFNSQLVVVADTAQVYHNGIAIYAGTYHITGDGVLEGDGATRLGAIRFAGNGAIGISGTITLDNDAGISARGVTTTGATISGKITGNHKLRLGRTTTQLGAQGNGIIILSNTANDWGGDTTIEEGTVKLGAANVLPNGASAGNLILKNDGLSHTNNTADTLLDLNGNSETVNGLSYDGASDLNKLKITTGSGAPTLTVGDNDATATYAGILQNGVSLTKMGNGSQTLTGVNTYSGGTTINAGTLALSGSGSIANTPRIVVAGGATFNVSGLSSTFALGGSQTLSNSTSTAVLNGNATTGSGTISLTYGSGTPSFTVTNGTLTLSSGTVAKVNNTGSALAVGSYKIISKAVSGNTGTVAGTAPSSVTVVGGGIAGGTVAVLQINSGELYLVVASTAPARINNIGVSGTTLSLSATNGVAGGPWTLLQSTNIALPFSQWATNRAGTYDGSGNLSTNIANVVTNGQMFYLLK